MSGGWKHRGHQERKKQEEQDKEQEKKDAVFNQEEEGVQDDTEVLRNLDWHIEINIYHCNHQRLTGTGERGAILGDKGGGSSLSVYGGKTRYVGLLWGF